jgi:deoxyribose-phosphate aldolase
MVAINSVQTSLCHQLLAGTPVHTGAAIGFPLGQQTIETKLFETTDALKNGADEIDYVINITEVKEKHFDYIEKEMHTLVQAVRAQSKIIKVIFENCYLTKDEIVTLATIAKKVKPDFIKTSTGFGKGGATEEDVRLMKETVGDEVGVKAAGGIRSYEDAMKMIAAGATRIGTSHGVEIISQAKEY